MLSIAAAVEASLSHEAHSWDFSGETPVGLAVHRAQTPLLIDASQQGKPVRDRPMLKRERSETERSMSVRIALRLVI